MSEPILKIVIALLLASSSGIATDKTEPALPGSTTPSPSLAIVQGEVRESAVGWHPYPDPVPGVVLPVASVPYESAETYQGIASQADESHGVNYLAMREPRGTRARICGAGDCLTLTVNDYGPSARIRPKRVADIAVGHWEAITGLPRSRGLGQVTVTVLSRPGNAQPTLPPTDVEMP